MKTDSRGHGIARLPRSTTRVLNGEDDVRTWSDDELIRGQRKNKNGKWTGKEPKVLPAEAVRELTRRRFQRAYVLIADSLADGAEMLVSIAKDERAPYMARLKAIELMMDRVLGKPKESIQLEVEVDDAPWQKLMAAAIVPLAANISLTEPDKNAKVPQLTRRVIDVTPDDEVLDDTQPWDEDGDEDEWVSIAPGIRRRRRRG